MIVQQLYKIQKEFGYLPRVELEALADRLECPLYRIEEVVSFFPHFRKSPPPEVTVRVCRDMACCLRGSHKLIDDMKEVMKGQPGWKVEGVSCLGRCDRAPAAMVETTLPLKAEPERSGKTVAESQPHPHHHQHAAGDHHEFLIAPASREKLSQVHSALSKKQLPQHDTDTAYEPHGSGNWEIEAYPGANDISQRYQVLRRFLALSQGASQDKRESELSLEDLREEFLHNVHYSLIDQDIKADPEIAVDGEKVRIETKSVNGKNVKKVIVEGRELDTRDFDATHQRASLSRDGKKVKIETLLFSGANLIGMGGAAARAHKKWGDVRDQPGSQKYVVCNGDESEPGTFKDRELLLRMPHLVVEGVILAGLVVGASRGFIYIRHEYHEQIEAVRQEIARAVEAGLCGPNMQGTGINFRLEVFVSPGGYICGEQTALIEAMEDRRGEPRIRPPELSANGLWDCPTLLNNVETLAWVPKIVLGKSGDKPADPLDLGTWYRSSGASGKYQGRRIFSVSGDIEKPGVYEVPIGCTLGELIDLCGGMLGGKSLKAVALSGPSGGFLPPLLPADFLPKDFKPENTAFEIRQLPLDSKTNNYSYKRTAPNGVSSTYSLMTGAGIVIYGEDSDMVEQALASTSFYRNETCGKCVPCRIGTQKLVDACDDLYRGKLSQADLVQLVSPDSDVNQLCATMQMTAICGLGQVASNPVATLLQFFQDDVKKYLRTP